ncbi:MAG: hypothetical protein L3J71_06045 [Victivallaceae bacterium]|nr:hypothetical protein [Victivallaceae bacterium]
MKNIIKVPILVILTLSPLFLIGSQRATADSIIKRVDFKKDLLGLKNNARIENDTVILKGAPDKYSKATFKLNRSLVGSDTFYLIGDVKLKDAEPGALSWYTAKLQVIYNNGKKNIYRGKKLYEGTIDKWMPLNLKVKIPANVKAKTFTVEVGMQNNIGTFYVKNIRLSKKPFNQNPVFTFPLPKQLNAGISINTKQKKKFNNSLLGLGANFMGVRPNKYQWNSPEIIKLVKKIKVPLLRFPGGTVANYYDFQSDMFAIPSDIKQRKSYVKAWRKMQKSGRKFEFDAYAKLVKALSIKSILVFNVRDDSIKRHLARLNNRLASGIDIALIELGNEMYLKQNLGGFTKNVTEYINRCNLIYKALKKQAPHISYAPNMVKVTNDKAWNKPVLEKTQRDAMVMHPYVSISYKNEPMDWVLMRSLLFSYSRLGKMLKAYDKSSIKDPLYLTEWGNLCSPIIGRSHLAALTTGDAFLNIINYSEKGTVKVANLWVLFGGYMGLYDMDQSNGDIIKTGGMATVYDLLIETFLNSDIYASKTTSYMLGQELPAINARATVNAAGEIKIFAINKTPMIGNFSITIDGNKYSETAKIKTYTRKDVIKPATFPLNKKLVTEKSVSGRIELPPYSVNVITIR